MDAKALYLLCKELAELLNMLALKMVQVVIHAAVQQR